MVDDRGFLVFSTFDGWKYQPGDDLQWADPEFDDSGWFDIPPGELTLDAMPDSLWKGYGWWRYTFIADSSLYNEKLNLYYFGWGAAEVFLDGERVHTFGNFSTDPNKERFFTPTLAVHPPVFIAEQDTHTIAVRYSYHEAKSYKNLNKIFEGSGNYGLGFRFGFGTHTLNQHRAQLITYNSFVLFFSGAVLLVLLLLHVTLFFKFPEDRSNLSISIAVGSLLISVMTVYSTVYLDVSFYWYTILTWIWSLSTSFAILFLPYVITQIFKLEKLKKVLWLIAFHPLLAILLLFDSSISRYTNLIVFSISFMLVCYICWKAFKSGKRGVQYVGIGAFGTLSLCIIYMLNSLAFIELSDQVFFLMIAFIYTLFPLGMTLYVANSYGYLFNSLESEINERTKKLKASLENLKATQSQLVQQEKLASLGQLTAGIAHEIKNPLNFVNNFSDLSVELIEEARAELKSQSSKSKFDSNEINELLDDIKTNLKKIHEHGSRADSIVKSMLLHSRGGSGEKNPTNLNAMIREYVNLSFHGMRAGKEPINVDINMDLDESIGDVPLIAEDFSRVILNLCNNAFDAMREKAIQNSELKIQNYSPKLTVRTKAENGNIHIEVEDNGSGIPEEMRDQIMQPFYTTKKGTEGTGLGLSISNDIIKAHGGTLDVRSSEDGALFIIQLPNH